MRLVKKKKKTTHIIYPTQASVYTDVLTFMRVKQAMNVVLCLALWQDN